MLVPFTVLVSLASFAPAQTTDVSPTNPFGLSGPGYVPNATLGPPLELYHEFYDHWPTGIAVSKSGRLFANFPVQTLINFTVGEITSGNTEAAFPNVSYNQPPSLLNSTNPQLSAGYFEYLISVQSVVVDPKDRLWMLDTGRPQVGSIQPYASGAGQKLVGVDLTTNTTFKVITFPPTVAYPDTLLNDVRFDLRPNLTASGEGIAYITDSSDEGRNGIIIVDLGTGESWRHLDRDASVMGDPSWVGVYDGVPFTPIRAMDSPISPGAYYRFTTGADGIALSADGEYLYYTPLSSRRLYRVPTALLRVPPGALNPSAAFDAIAGVEFLGQHGSHADGLETSSDGTIWVTAPEQDAIFSFNPTTKILSPFVRDPRIQWCDTVSIGEDGYMYFTSNQFTRQPQLNNGTDYRIKPFAVFRVKLPNNATKYLQRNSR
ncbi:MRJP-domain-containing protein [Calocera cornea HHB12733]|uniref:MRJP-domain-containing protein n=1 Tax=Calocera cornea HHB12733 TaxID=1353952 RepID=A0A165DM80_9BASI|nr:MRJP-domain-containing protein [Calocera cornea HHB12733]